MRIAFFNYNGGMKVTEDPYYFLQMWQHTTALYMIEKGEIK